jgi:hypothetical protein
VLLPNHDQYTQAQYHMSPPLELQVSRIGGGEGEGEAEGGERKKKGAALIPVETKSTTVPIYTLTEGDQVTRWVQFIPGKRYKRKDIHAAVGGQAQSGISTPRANSVILCFTTNCPHATGYYDNSELRTEGTWIFSGQGQDNMEFKGGNLQLRDHKKSNKRVLLFTSDKKSSSLGVLFEAEVQVTYAELAGVANLSGKARTAILFRLQRVGMANEPVIVHVADPEGKPPKKRTTTSQASTVVCIDQSLAPYNYSIQSTATHTRTTTPPPYLAITASPLEAPPTPPVKEEDIPKILKRVTPEKPSEPRSKKKPKKAAVANQPPQPHQTCQPQQSHQIPQHPQHIQKHNAPLLVPFTSNQQSRQPKNPSSNVKQVPTQPHIPQSHKKPLQEHQYPVKQQRVHTPPLPSKPQPRPQQTLRIHLPPVQQPSTQQASAHLQPTRLPP